jgi:hypothetical protein
METFSTTLPLHRAGKLRILAFCHSKRAAIAPEIPTMIEAGVKGYEAYTFSLILGPAGMPQDVIDTLDKASREVMADPPPSSSSRAMPHPDAGHHARAHGAVHQGRACQVGADHPRRQRQDRLATLRPRVRDTGAGAPC